jgi:hypothetical protein
MARDNFSITILLGLVAAGTGCVTDDGSAAPNDETSATSVSEAALIGDPVYPTAHPRIYLTPNRARLKAALDSNTPAAAKFKSKTDAWLAGSDVYNFQAWNAALLGQLTGTASYCSKAIAVTDLQVSTAEAKIATGVAPEVAADSYLNIGDMIGGLALVYDWCYPQVTAAQRTRWLAYANQAVWNVWNYNTARWGSQTIPWSGWSVNNPSNNYYYSFLRATMLLGLATKGENPQADAWITTFRDAKVIAQLVPQFTTDLVGGSSREGTGYGVAMRKLFELYDFWKATTGEQLATRTPHTRASLLAMIHQTMPTLDRVPPTGDHSRDSTAAFFDYHRDYLQQLMAIFPSDPLAGRAKYLIANSSVKTMGNAFMMVQDFINDNPSIPNTSFTGLNTVYHAKGIGEIYARSGWDTGATWINLIAGPYTESHAHQDQGSLMIFKGGWLAYDANINSHSGLAQDTTAHSLVRIDSGGVPIKQIASTTSTVLALKKAANFTYAAADVTPAYRNNAAIQKVQRELVYVQPNVAIVFDRVQTTAATTQTWQLAVPTAPVISGNTATITNAGHNLKLTRIAPSAATMSTYDFTANADFNGGFRVDERVAGGDQRYLHVLAVDGAVSSTVAAGATGVTVNLASGQQITVTFNRDTVGGSLTIAGVTTALAAGVDTLAE